MLIMRERCQIVYINRNKKSGFVEKGAELGRVRLQKTVKYSQLLALLYKIPAKKGNKMIVLNNNCCERLHILLTYT